MPMGIVLPEKEKLDTLKTLDTLTIGFTSSSLIKIEDEIEVVDLFVYSRPEHKHAFLSAYPVLIDFLIRKSSIDSFYKVITRAGGSKELVFSKLNTYLQALCHNSCVDETMNVFGFGRGLTPSSDDFILGLSSIFQYMGDKRLELIKVHGKKYLETTTFVSCQMLRNAWLGHYNFFIHQLLQAIVHNQLSEEILLSTTSYGHTSGMDTLFGITTGIKIIKDNSIPF